MLNCVLSQTYYFDVYGVKDGLPQSNVYSIIQDKEGYVWLSTKSGVSRFDGINFENFSKENGIAENGVQCILEDSQSYIWFGHTNGGISRYYKNSAKEVIFDSLTSKYDITSIIEDKNGYVWFSTNGNGVLVIYNPHVKNLKDIKYKHFKGEKGSLSDRVFNIYKSPSNELYFITDAGIKTFDYNKNSFDYFKIENLPMYFQITAMLEDNIGNYWFGTYNGGLYKFDKNKKEFEFYDLKNGLSCNWISCIMQDSQGFVWVGTWGGGINLFKKNKKDITYLNNSNGLLDNKIRTIKEDREGNILIGTNENGLAIFKGEQFVLYSQKEGITNQQVWAINQDKKGRYWFGTNGGITIIDNNKVINFNHKTGFKIDQLLFLNVAEQTDQIRFLKTDNSGNTWIGTWGGGIIEYKDKTSKFEFNPVLNGAIRELYVTAMDIDKNNILWIGTIDGLIKYDINKNEYEHFTQINGLGGNDISSLFSASNNDLWIGCKSKDICVYRNKNFIKLKFPETISPTTIKEDFKGNILIGTDNTGVFVVDLKSLDIKQHIRTKDGLMSDYISIIETDKNNIYIGTNYGLNKINCKTKEIISYTEKNGFVGIEAKNNASFKDKSGNLWFGTIKGAIRYNPDLEYYRQIEPITHIYKFRVNLKEKELDSNISLNYQDRSIIFDFNSICLRNPSSVKYKYMLEGADEDWRIPTKQSNVHYSALQPGIYTFKIKATNYTGNWNEKPVTFSFIIEPPFWQTWWFYIFITIIGLIVLIIYIKIREKTLIKEKQILEIKVKERTLEIVQKNEELAKKNKSITDSINYAQNIQRAILPNEHLFKENFSDSFVLFLPKDIVSGDFYWLEKVNNSVYIAAVDCTGHGVPGALMSIVGHNLLNQALNENHILKPSEILNYMRHAINLNFKYTDNQTMIRDGMDIALCSINYDKMTLEYSGAYNSLYIIQNGKFEEIQPERYPIAILNDEVNISEKYTNHEININKNDVFYIFSDGYVDQYGECNNKKRKFSSKRFKELLSEIYKEPMINQKNILYKNHLKWKGDIEQIDDILIIGIKI